MRRRPHQTLCFFAELPRLMSPSPTHVVSILSVPLYCHTVPSVAVQVCVSRFYAWMERLSFYDRAWKTRGSFDSSLESSSSRDAMLTNEYLFHWFALNDFTPRYVQGRDAHRRPVASTLGLHNQMQFPSSPGMRNCINYVLHTHHTLIGAIAFCTTQYTLWNRECGRRASNVDGDRILSDWLL